MLLVSTVAPGSHNIKPGEKYNNSDIDKVQIFELSKAL